MSLTIAELLLPRYRNILPYPDSQYIVGEIITIVEKFGESFQRVKRTLPCEGKMVTDILYDATQFDAYPAVFKRVEWWEGRFKYDMPDYVRKLGTKQVFKVDQYTTDSQFSIVINRRVIVLKEIRRVEDLMLLEPSTKEEYDLYREANKCLYKYVKPD